MSASWVHLSYTAHPKTSKWSRGDLERWGIIGLYQWHNRWRNDPRHLLRLAGLEGDSDRKRSADFLAIKANSPDMAEKARVEITKSPTMQKSLLCGTLASGGLFQFLPVFFNPESSGFQAPLNQQDISILLNAKSIPPTAFENSLSHSACCVKFYACVAEVEKGLPTLCKPVAPNIFCVTDRLRQVHADRRPFFSPIAFNLPLWQHCYWQQIME